MRYPPFDQSPPIEPTRPAPGPIPGLEYLLRFFALLDALLVPAAVGYWITTLPGRGQLVGAVLGTWVLWWAIKRGSMALFAFDEYRWFSRHLLKLFAFGLLLKAVSVLLR
ncbi:MAG: hypothetical protein ABI330_16960 [Caldimonas sp.]